MSRLWDSLKEVERYEAEVTDRSAQADSDLVAERRCSERLWLYSPLLVYGHTTENEPFHEGTEGLHVNAGGGLITLTTSVTNGQSMAYGRPRLIATGNPLIGSKLWHPNMFGRYARFSLMDLI